MYISYTKQPIDDNSKKSKKFHKKNKKVQEEDERFEFFQSESSENEKNLLTKEISTDSSDSRPQFKGFSEDDYINELAEYQELLMSSAFDSKEQEVQEEETEYLDTCKELEGILEEDKEKISEVMKKTMMSICEENVKWFLPIETAFEENYEFDILDNLIINDEDFIVSIQQRIFDINKSFKKKEESQISLNNKKYSDVFPTLSDVAPAPNNKFDNIEFLKQEYKSKPKKDDGILSNLGNPSFMLANKNTWNQSQNDKLYQTSAENEQSGKDVKALSILFPDIILSYIKVAYVMFGDDLEITKQFLKEYFKDSYKDGAIIQNYRQIQKERNAARPKKSNFLNNDFLGYNNLEEIDPELRGESFSSLRNGVRRHLRLKYVFKKSEMTCINLKNYDQANKFKNLSNEQNALLEKYKTASKIIFLSKLRKQNNYRDIDLHGFYLEEALDIVIDQIRYMKSKMDLGLITDYASQNIKKYPYLKYNIITGKGKNSQNNLPVLLPSIKKLFERKKFEFKAFEHEGRIEIYIPF